MKSFAVLGWFGIPHGTHHQLGKYLRQYGEVYFGLVRFFKDGKEVVTKSRPLYGYERAYIIESWGYKTFYWDFHNPYAKYLLPKYAEEMREKILNQLPENTVFYTRSSVANFILKSLKLNVEYSLRTGVSATQIREKLYKKEKVDLPKETLEMLEKVSSRLENLSKDKDRTLRVFGFKIPVEGLLT